MKFGMQQVQLASIAVQIARKNKKHKKMAQSPNPADWYPSHTDPDQTWCLRGVRWIRISTNLDLKVDKAQDTGRFEPDPAQTLTYKGLRPGLAHSFPSSVLSSSPSRFLSSLTNTQTLASQILPRITLQHVQTLVLIVLNTYLSKLLKSRDRCGSSLLLRTVPIRLVLFMFLSTKHHESSQTRNGSHSLWVFDVFSHFLHVRVS